MFKKREKGQGKGKECIYDNLRNPDSYRERETNTRNIYFHLKRLWLQVAKIINVLTFFDNKNRSTLIIEIQG